ncbi:MAG: HD domain-containing protein [Syntrophomonadaceae bacterium]|nr:HD domain-containing protein [Syntrophomonadaceae bacterium]
MALSDAVDLISPVLNNHHKQAAYISYKIAKILNFSDQELTDLVIAALLHDVGALSHNERIELLDFEEKNPHLHTISGFVLLNDLEIFKRAGKIIKHHHLPWQNGAGKTFNDESVYLESHIIYLADRIAASLNQKSGVLNQAGNIIQRIKSRVNNRFHPQFVEIFETISAKEAFWLDLVSPSIDDRLEIIWEDCSKLLSLKELLDVTKVFARIIDFRSRFTSVHTSGVAAVAGAIAGKMNWSEEDCIKIAIAGNLHDLGKLTVPNEILEKPGRLTKEEYNIMKTHTYHSYYILSKVEGLEEINEYGAFHHERMDGNGYPFKIKGEDLKEGSRITAIADVLTAITEDRPYRKGMQDTQAIQIIEKMGQDSKLDTEIIALVKENFDQINAARIKAQQQATNEYKAFERKLQQAKNLYCSDTVNTYQGTNLYLLS